MGYSVTMRKFVILKHECPQTIDHWDLMLEQSDHLTCWQAPLTPSKWGHSPITLTKIFDHRKKYLHFEGEISNNRGKVSQIDHGEYRYISKSTNEWEIELTGVTLKGTWKIKQMVGHQWELQKV